MPDPPGLLMPALQTTRKSLIVRVRDVDDSHAWSEFVEIYGPLVYRFGRDRGLQDSDAADLSQMVLMEVARCIERFDYDAKIGRFRNWLLVIARSKFSNLVSKKARLKEDGGSQAFQTLSEHSIDDTLADQWEHEYRQHLFQWAAETVRLEVEEPTWNAFWQTAVEGQPVTRVAEQTGLKVGSVYVAKSRVLVRIRAKIAEVDDSVHE
ncbi:MAG: sigma-70 family RNA polymerase sigma factor [Planctomycetota bacterium]